MNHLKQVTWIAAAEKRLKDLEDAAIRMVALLDKLADRLIALEAKRGPGRPKVERNSDRDN